jgi:hypothetical protein
MATTRRPPVRPPRSQITPEALRLFKRVLSGEADGGRHDEFVLHEMLGLGPADITVFDAVGEPTKEDLDHGWHRVVALRKALDAALEAEEAAK